MYTTQSVKLAYRMSKADLAAIIARHGVMPASVLIKWSKDELVNAWLEHFGERGDSFQWEPCEVYGSHAKGHYCPYHGNV